MPDRKGRKRRPRDHRSRDAAPASVSPPAVAPTKPTTRGDPAVPSNTARATGFAIAVITVFLAVMTFKDAIDGDHATVDAVMRAAVGVFLVLLGIVVGLLSLFPAQVRRIVRGA